MNQGTVGSGVEYWKELDIGILHEQSFCESSNTSLAESDKESHNKGNFVSSEQTVICNQLWSVKKLVILFIKPQIEQITILYKSANFTMLWSIPFDSNI